MSNLKYETLYFLIMYYQAKSSNGINGSSTSCSGGRPNADEAPRRVSVMRSLSISAANTLGITLDQVGFFSNLEWNIFEPIAFFFFISYLWLKRFNLKIIVKIIKGVCNI